MTRRHSPYEHSGPRSAVRLSIRGPLPPTAAHLPFRECQRETSSRLATADPPIGRLTALEVVPSSRSSVGAEQPAARLLNQGYTRAAPDRL